MESTKVLTYSDLAKVSTQVTPLIYYLRQKSPRDAGDSLRVDVSSAPPQDLTNCVHQLLQALEYNNNDLTNSQLRYIFSCYEVNIWSLCLVKILTEASPRFVDPDVCEEIVSLTEAFLEHGTDEEPVETLMKELVEPLDKLKRIRFYALGEVCAMIRDCSVESNKVASDLGPRIFMVSEPSDAKFNAATYLFQLFIRRGEDMFGQAANSNISLDSFGIRKKNRFNAAGNQYWDLDVLMPASYKHKKTLKSFYNQCDPKYTPIVDSLMKYHSLQDIAEGLYRKYKLIPVGWKGEIQKLKQSGERLDWFNADTVQSPSPGAKGTPTNIERNPSIPSGPRSDIDQNIDSFINGEIIYYRQMRALGKYYVFQLNEVLRKDPMNNERISLGLSQLVCDRLFGLPWQQIMDLCHHLLIQLEVLNLVRLQPKSPHTRVGIFADIICSVTPDRLYYAYANYFSTLKGNSIIMNELLGKLNSLQVLPGCRSFLQIWEDVRNQHKILARFSLPELIALPMGRMATYKVILGNLVAQAQITNNPKSIEKMSEAYRRFMQVDEALKQAYVSGQSE